MSSICKGECQFKNFWFSGVGSDTFHNLLWTEEHKWFFFYRCLMAYCLFVWTLIDYTTSVKSNLWQFLSHWSECTVTIYFVVQFFVALRVDYLQTDREELLPRELRWFHKLAWVLSSISVVFSFSSSLLFGIIIPFTQSKAVKDSIVINTHAIVLLFVLIETFMVRFPVRILHFIYPLLFGVLFTVMVWVLHLAETYSTQYKGFDFKNQPKMACAVLFTLTAILVVTFHFVHFALFRLRQLISRYYFKRMKRVRIQEPIRNEYKNSFVDDESQNYQSH